VATGDGATVEFQVPQHPVIAASEHVNVGGVAFTDPANYSLDDDLGLITFVAAPGFGLTIVVTYRYTALTDAALTEFLALEGDRDKRAAALALETIASDNAMVLKVMRLLDLQTDGAKVSDALLKRAAELRKQDEADDVDGAFGYAEQVVNSFSERERLLNQALRGS
jgi:hypothetical protein